MNIKDSITGGLKDKRFRLQQKVQHLENQTLDIEIAESNYNSAQGEIIQRLRVFTHQFMTIYLKIKLLIYSAN